MLRCKTAVPAPKSPISRQNNLSTRPGLEPGIWAPKAHVLPITPPGYYCIDDCLLIIDDPWTISTTGRVIIHQSSLINLRCHGDRFGAVWPGLVGGLSQPSRDAADPDDRLRGPTLPRATMQLQARHYNELAQPMQRFLPFFFENAAGITNQTVSTSTSICRRAWAQVWVSVRPQARAVAACRAIARAARGLWPWWRPARKPARR